MKFCNECNHFKVRHKFGYGSCHFMEKKLGVIRSLGIIDDSNLVKTPNWCPLEDADKDDLL